MITYSHFRKNYSVSSYVHTPDCYEMDKTGISMFEILEPGGQLWANTAFEGSQFYSIGVPKFYSWVNVISVYAYNDLG